MESPGNLGQENIVRSNNEAWFWNQYLCEFVLDRLDRLRSLRNDTIMPSLNDTEEAIAREIDKRWKSIMALPSSPDIDPASIAERIQEEAPDWYVSLAEFRLHLNGLFCVAIWREVEVFQRVLLGEIEKASTSRCGGKEKRRSSRSGAKKRADQPNSGDVVSRYAAAGIDLSALAGADDVDTLRLVNNAYKHGPGRSLDELRQKALDMTGLDGPNVNDAFVEQSFGAAGQYLAALVEHFGAIMDTRPRRFLE